MYPDLSYGNSNIDDTSLKYIQFSTLHWKFFTYEKLHKIAINDSPLCTFLQDDFR